MILDDATRVRVIRAILGLNRRQMAEKVGVTPFTITDWETGRARPRGRLQDRMALVAHENGLAFLPSGMPVPAKDCLLLKEA